MGRVTFCHLLFPNDTKQQERRVTLLGPGSGFCYEFCLRLERRDTNYNIYNWIWIFKQCNPKTSGVNKFSFIYVSRKIFGFLKKILCLRKCENPTRSLEHQSQLSRCAWSTEQCTYAQWIYKYENIFINKFWFSLSSSSSIFIGMWNLNLQQ